MTEQKLDGLKTPPEKLLKPFTASRFLLWIAAAAVVHAVFIGILSVGYIRAWVDPEGAAVRKAAAEAAAKLAAASRLPARAVTNAAAGSKTNAPVPSVAPPATGTATNQTGATTDALLNARQNTPIVKAVTDKPKPEDIPRTPDDIGIRLEDTSVK